MRRWLLVVGLVVAFAGMLLVFVPITTTQSPRIWWNGLSSYPAQYVSAPVTKFALVSAVQFTLTWTSSAPNGSAFPGVEVFDCGYNSTCNNSVFEGYPMAEAWGPSGSLTWQGGAGQLFEVNPHSATYKATLTTSYRTPLAGGLPGVGLATVGGAVAAAGILLRKRTPPSPPLSVGGAE